MPAIGHEYREVLAQAGFHLGILAQIKNTVEDTTFAGLVEYGERKAALFSLNEEETYLFTHAFFMGFRNQEGR